MHTNFGLNSGRNKTWAISFGFYSPEFLILGQNPNYLLKIAPITLTRLRSYPHFAPMVHLVTQSLWSFWLLDLDNSSNSPSMFSPFLNIHLNEKRCCEVYTSQHLFLFRCIFNQHTNFTHSWHYITENCTFFCVSFDWQT